MDLEGLLQSVIRFSNFMTSRLVVLMPIHGPLHNLKVKIGNAVAQARGKSAEPVA